MSDAPDSRLARLRRLPPRLRIVHLAALLRAARRVNADERFLSYPSPAERVGRVAVAKRRSGGGANNPEKGQLLGFAYTDPHPVAHFIRADPPHKGEGKESARIFDRLARKEGSSTERGRRE